jgi:hypothetical protein
MDKEAKEAPRLEYHPPRLERYGTLSELTQAGRTHPGNDFVIYKDGFQGSAGPQG